jgi:bifunctional non-homologous end joining protein LigD
MIFDLDPGKNVSWDQVRKGPADARLPHELELPAFLKTSGGKGLHVVVPVKPGYGWDDVKAFRRLSSRTWRRRYRTASC